MPEHDLTTMGDRCRWVREHVLGWSDERLADAITPRLPRKPSRMAISRWERDVHAPPIQFVEALAELAGVSIDWIVRGVGPKGSATDVLRRIRRLIDELDEQYKIEPEVPPLAAFRRIDTD